MQTITDYKGKHSHELPSDTSIPDELNYFYALFEASNTKACIRASTVLDNHAIKLSVADVSKTFKQVNIHKAISIALHTALSPLEKKDHICENAIH